MEVDVLVIGGGPAGLMAAIAAGEEKANVMLVEKGGKLGRKLAISGGGRCNVTNRLPIDKIIQHIPGNGRFLYSAFSIFNNEDIIHFFQKLGVELKEEDHGRMFPVKNDAKFVVRALLSKLDELGVKIRTYCPVEEIIYKNDQMKEVVLKDGERILAKSVIVAVGGKSVPHTGSTGDGYAWAKKAGHTITELYPTEVPLLSDEPFIQMKTLQGLSLRDVNLSVLNPKGKPIITHRMDMLFTHFGVSGPAVLRCSQFVVKAKKKWNLDKVTLKIDALPDVTEEAIYHQLMKKRNKEPKKSVKNALKGLLPERYLLFLLELNDIDPSSAMTTVSKEKCRRLSNSCKHFLFTVYDTQPLEKAFVTGGGVSVKEIDPKTMESKKMNGLFFSGEILDIHGYTGGFNITAALVTGRLAGLNAAKRVKNGDFGDV
ncbi:NAD(P)/FAD-dependent oxidoreductase [Fervidibacillus albus]|uniref:NAD(P)/FAD-dependent oxidoreductase n=1 Tax=Fervidibacillus albus TaxID=2980026 RepID=A0A9E8LV68_9BACI|nr:NAD(P)/FAD-dependent oxidoreductase [Fervidibacillus albus]WAA10071.1 NAD(P)/FAD-dependent oxidoreductase [Fervidibacillus albus]